MTKETTKPEGKVTKAGAVELEESELDEVSGGALFLKIKGVPDEGVDRNSATGGDLPQIIGDGSYKLDTTGKTFTR